MLVPDNEVFEMSVSFVILNKQGALKLIVTSHHQGTLPVFYSSFTLNTIFMYLTFLLCGATNAK
jgi:hypothetical protein